MLVEGQITSFSQLPEREGKNPIHRVSVEGFSMLINSEVFGGLDHSLFSSNGYVKLRVSTYWPRNGDSKRPTFWVQDAQKGTF